MLPEPSLSCGNSTCPKTPQSGFLEEAEAVPAESIHPKRSRTERNASYRLEPRSDFAVYINCEDEKQRNLRMELIKVIYWDNQSHFTVLFMIQGSKYDTNNLAIMIDHRTSAIPSINRRFHH